MISDVMIHHRLQIIGLIREVLVKIIRMSSEKDHASGNVYFELKSDIRELDTCSYTVNMVSLAVLNVIKV